MKTGNRGKFLALTYYESHLIDVPLNSWWIDSGASIHITNSLQGIQNKRKPHKDEVNLCVGNGNDVKVEWTGDVSLQLESSFVLILKNVVFVPSIRRNLISLSKLDEMGFSFTFNNRMFTLSYE